MIHIPLILLGLVTAVALVDWLLFEEPRCRERLERLEQR